MSNRLVFKREIKLCNDLDQDSYENGFGKWFTQNVLRPVQGLVGNIASETQKFVQNPKLAIQKSWDYNTKQISKVATNYVDELKKLATNPKEALSKSWNYNSRKVGEVGQKFIDVIRRYFPVTVILRQGILAAFTVNLFGMASKLRPATLEKSEAKKLGYSDKDISDAQSGYTKAWHVYRDLGGQEKWLRGAIKDGAKKKIAKIEGKSLVYENAEGVIQRKQWILTNQNDEYFNAVVVDDLAAIITAMSAILGIYTQIKGLKKSPSDKPSKEQEMGANPPTENDGKEALIQQIANNPDLNDEEKALLVASIETAGVMAVADMMIDKTQQNKEASTTNQYLLYGGIGFGVLVLTGVAIYVIKKRGKNKGK